MEGDTTVSHREGRDRRGGLTLLYFFASFLRFEASIETIYHNLQKQRSDTDSVTPSCKSEHVEPRPLYRCDRNSADGRQRGGPVATLIVCDRRGRT